MWGLWPRFSSSLWSQSFPTQHLLGYVHATQSSCLTAEKNCRTDSDTCGCLRDWDTQLTVSCALLTESADRSLPLFSAFQCAMFSLFNIRSNKGEEEAKKQTLGYGQNQLSRNILGLAAWALVGWGAPGLFRAVTIFPVASQL